MAMEWKNQLTRTPYLVLFIVLISMGVGTASALITITLAGDVHVLGEMKIDETLLMGTDNPNDDDGIRFDDGSEVLFWDESEDSFMVTDDLVTQGDLKTVGDLRVGTDDGADDDNIFFDSGLENLTWDESEGRFFLSDSLLLNEDLYVSGVFSIDDDSIYFDIGTDESLTWKNGADRFEFSNDLFVDGEITSSSTKTKVLSIGHQEFQPYRGSLMEYGGTNAARWIIDSPQALPILRATIHTIPDGAIITDLECRVVDNSADHDIKCSISSILEDGFSLGYGFDGSSTGASSEIQVLSPNSPSPITVDRDTLSYYVDFLTLHDPNTTACGEDCKMLHVKITYTVTGLN